MLLGLRFLQIMLGATLDDLDTVIPETLEELNQGELLRLAMIQRDHDGSERALKAGLLQQQLDDLAGLGALFQLQHQPEPVPVRLVPDLGQVRNAAFSRKIRDLANDPRLRDRVWEFGDDELFLAAPQRLLHDAGTHDDPAPSGLVHVSNSASPDHESRRGEVGPR